MKGTRFLWLLILTELLGAGCAHLTDPGTKAKALVPAPCAPTWSLIPTANVGKGDNELAAVSGTSSTDIWAVGYSRDVVSGEASSLIQHWDGQNWSVIVSPNVSDMSNFLKAVDAIAPDDVWAVGDFHKEGIFGTYPQTLAEHWDGTAWTIFPSRNPSTGDNILYGVKGFSADDVWAVGDAYAVDTALTLHWDGQAWTVFPGPEATSLKHLFAIDGSSPDDLWSVGYHFDPSLDFNQPLFGHWDGESWSTYVFPGPQTEEQAYGIAIVSADEAWAVGRTGTDPDISGVFSQHWDGTNWSDLLANPVGPGDLNILASAAALSAADVWAAGYYTVSNGETVTSRPLLENWNGEEHLWARVDIPDPGPGDAKLPGLTVIPGVSELWSVGSLTDVNTGALRTMALEDCPIEVGEMGFLPSQARVKEPGVTVDWSMRTGPTSHDIVDATGLGLFDSGPKTPPASFSASFFSAGTYRILGQGTSQVMALGVSARASPKSGGPTTPLLIAWAIHKAFRHQTFDVQILRPGSSVYEDWIRGRRPNAAFTPDAGLGVYSFRARLRNTDSGAMAGYSPAVSVLVR